MSYKLQEGTVSQTLMHFSADLLALVGDVYGIFVTFPCGILGQVWYLIVSFPDLCRLSYFYMKINVASPGQHIIVHYLPYKRYMNKVKHMYSSFFMKFDPCVYSYHG